MDLLIWGNLGQDVIKYYKINDYLLIEGFISLRKKSLIIISKSKISVTKIYPLNRESIQILTKL